MVIQQNQVYNASNGQPNWCCVLSRSGVAGTTDEVSFGARYSMDNITGYTIEAETASGTKDSESNNYGVSAIWCNYCCSSADHVMKAKIEKILVLLQALDGMHVAFSTFESEDSADRASNLDEKLTASHAELGYSIAPGLSAFLSYSNFEYENGGNSTSIDDDGTLTKLTIKATF